MTDNGTYLDFTPAQVWEWAAKKYPTNSTVDRRLMKLAEEVGELNGAVIKRDEGRKTDADVAVELGDAVICLWAVAEALGLDPVAEANRIWWHRDCTHG